jgi:hypothetical protein
MTSNRSNSGELNQTNLILPEPCGQLAREADAAERKVH